MTASSTPEQSARAILAIFRARNCFAGDPLEISDIKTQFLENRGSADDCNAGLLYAVDNGWLVVIPTERDTGPHNMRTLTEAGFAQI